MMTAELPLNPLPLPAGVVVEIVGTAVVVVEVGKLCCGNPGSNGFVPWAAAAAGNTTANPSTTARTPRGARTAVKPYASGCSIAGVSGASAYGCSSATSSSW